MTLDQQSFSFMQLLNSSITLKKKIGCRTKSLSKKYLTHKELLLLEDLFQ